MKLVGIRNRMLLAAVLPVTLVAVLLAGVFLFFRFEDIKTAHSQRARALTRQLATACEYGVFSGNINHLQSLASGALREAGVRSVMVLGAKGQILVRAGLSGYAAPPILGLLEIEQFDPRTQIDLLL
ncbi:MAG: hypothetical protein KJ614_09150 [Gammaproteobacteria bacterium]|uniref:hypothetical protein n=1 Tax=Rhodoferax sp. TaxID=50421 RepID=UPI00179244F6|nr:hypothetical protein [Rhodoferax sp.]MBU3899077.1 hypothetical protein [Gammaproteobacteria bacterium]MBA3057623.1 hypothetical protein [Rhodoferax sp.]MBU3997637.1 hypothetical protein [Gammaproteobacteria bacterium]MBU4018521.1 hypothetical protein [Gammaproteobacteria bacterium]MBU4080533.1 hypothetical protein [Gammaproteobacteria bacterium]